MKKILSTLVIALSILTAYSQANVPEANSFGMQYGVNFNGTVNQAVQLSGWIKKGIEIRGAMTFSYVNNQSNNSSGGNFIQIYHGNNQYSYIPETQVTTSSSATLIMSHTLSVVKHFTIKSNLDFFVGGGATYGISVPTAWSTNTNTITADSLYNYTSTSSKGPLTFNWGLSVLGGANFFFYKNLAIGADFGLGFSAANSNGSYTERDIRVSNGAYNYYEKLNYDHTAVNRLTNAKYTLAFAGNAGLHLTYYVKVKTKDKSVPPPNPEF